MFFRQFHLPSLGHASYIVGDETTGSALVLDPRRDVDCYFEALRSQGLRLAYALDTHGHNDYLSGIREIGARQSVEALGFASAKLGYAHRGVKDGEIIEMGDVALEILHTPGHTPEHLSVLVYDRSTGSEPTMLLSGGALLVGDLARPDLLGGPDAAREAARDFCHTVQEKILWRLPDHVEVWPTHVAGSLCGGNIGSRLSTTVGFERKTNPILARVSSSEEFVDECIRLDNLPAVPPYWRRMRRQNLAGPELLGVLQEPPALTPEQFDARRSEGAVVLDARSPDAFAGAHIPGALNVGLGSSFPTWVGTVLPVDSDVLLVLEQPEGLWVATWEMLRIGYAPPVGWLGGGMQTWRTTGHPVDAMGQIDVHRLKRLVDGDEIDIIDVRQPAEWAAGHVAGASFITGAELPARVHEVARDRSLAVMCGAGFRSSVAASLLAREGFENVTHVLGGMSAWRSAGYATTTL